MLPVLNAGLYSMLYCMQSVNSTIAAPAVAVVYTSFWLAMLCRSGVITHLFAFVLSSVEAMGQN